MSLLIFGSYNRPNFVDGSKLDPFYLYMIKLRLLRNADTKSQNHIAHFHIDGTYKTNVLKDISKSQNLEFGVSCDLNTAHCRLLIAACIIAKIVPGGERKFVIFKARERSKDINGALKKRILKC